MKFDCKSYFKHFLNKNLTMENSQEVYEVFYTLESGEENLFRNCCKILGIDKEVFLKGFEGTEIFDVDEDAGLTAIAAAERFGRIEYEYPDKPTYGTIKDLVMNHDSREYMEFRQKLYHAAACEIVDSFDESEYGHLDIITVIEKMGVFNERNRQCVYLRTEDALVRLRRKMYMHDIHDSLDEQGEPTDKFIDRTESFFNSLGKIEKSALLSALGIAKELIGVVEKAGHDCL